MSEGNPGYINLTKRKCRDVSCDFVDEKAFEVHIGYHKPPANTILKIERLTPCDESTLDEVNEVTTTTTTEAPEELTNTTITVYCNEPIIGSSAYLYTSDDKNNKVERIANIFNAEEGEKLFLYSKNFLRNTAKSITLCFSSPCKFGSFAMFGQ